MCRFLWSPWRAPIDARQALKWLAIVDLLGPLRMCPWPLATRDVVAGVASAALGCTASCNAARHTACACKRQHSCGLCQSSTDSNKPRPHVCFASAGVSHGHRLDCAHCQVRRCAHAVLRSLCSGRVVPGTLGRTCGRSVVACVWTGCMKGHGIVSRRSEHARPAEGCIIVCEET